MDANLLIPSGDPAGTGRLSSALEAAFLMAGAPARPVAFACIGTDRSTGDALGPLVGQKLLRLGLDDEAVVGTLERPLHALNMAERLRPLLDHRPTPLIVAVDAALGALTSVGAIQLRSGGLRPGEGVGKDIPEVGELAITATVNVRAGSLDVQVLQSTRLWLVQGLADTIGTACWWALRNARRAGAPALAEVVAA
jgi:putative sporulation protein YyaC